MLGIVLIVVIGRYFYRLAEEYDKSKWGFAIIGIATYYGTLWITAFIYAIIYFSLNPYATEADFSELLAGFIGIVFGLVGAYVLYHILERNWKKNASKDKVSIDDIGKDTTA